MINKKNQEVDVYRHKKPSNLYIVAYEGIDTAGKTTSFTALKMRVIQQNYTQQISQASLSSLNEKYEIPLQVEGTPLFDDYGSFFMMNLNKNQSIFVADLEASKADFYISKKVDCVTNMFLTLPHKGVPSYSNIKKVLEADSSIPKRQESRFRAFVINYHESMQYVFNYIKRKPKVYSKPDLYVLYTDRSWISNFVYNGYSGDIEDTDALLKKVQQAKYHPVDLATLFIIDEQTLQERMKERATLSYYEKYGIKNLMKFQEKYLYLINQLHKIGYIKNFTVVNKSFIDTQSQLNYITNG